MQSRLLRRSDFRPTRMRGVVGQKWRTSGYHWRYVLAQMVRREDLEATYFVHDILEGIGAVDGEADEKKIGFRVGKWSETVIFFLTCSIPQRQLDCLAAWLVVCVGDVVLEDCRDVFLVSISQSIPCTGMNPLPLESSLDCS